jgi:prephenate dehydrogenase
MIKISGEIDWRRLVKAQTVSIIGMGRLGVSIGLALKAAQAGLTVLGHDRIEERTREAKEKLAAIDKAEWNLISAVEVADILILAMPLAELEDTLAVSGDEVQPHALVLDLSSLKGLGLKWAKRYLRRGHYVGASPILTAASLADGREGPSAGSADLFRNSIFCLTPSATADPQAVETAVNFGLLLGATPYFVDPLEYDSLIQGVETMPGLLAAAMFSTVHQSNGWRDMLRFANTPFALLTQPLNQGSDIARLAFNDKAATLRWLDALIDEMQAFRRQVVAGDEEALSLIVEELWLKREKWLKERAQNNWLEVQTPEIEHRGLAEQMLGGWIAGRGKKEE